MEPLRTRLQGRTMTCDDESHASEAIAGSAPDALLRRVRVPAPPEAPDCGRLNAASQAAAGGESDNGGENDGGGEATAAARATARTRAKAGRHTAGSAAGEPRGAAKVAGDARDARLSRPVRAVALPRRHSRLHPPPRSLVSAARDLCVCGAGRGPDRGQEKQAYRENEVERSRVRGPRAAAHLPKRPCRRPAAAGGAPAPRLNDRSRPRPQGGSG